METKKTKWDPTVTVIHTELDSAQISTQLDNICYLLN